jgi:hypothetical protein
MVPTVFNLVADMDRLAACQSLVGGRYAAHVNSEQTKTAMGHRNRQNAADFPRVLRSRLVMATFGWS